MLCNITRKPARLDIINCLLQFNLNQGVIMVSILVLASISISSRKSGNKKNSAWEYCPQQIRCGLWTHASWRSFVYFDES